MAEEPWEWFRYSKYEKFRSVVSKIIIALMIANLRSGGGILRRRPLRKANES